MTLCIADLDPKFQARIRIDDDGHWIWTGVIARTGYGHWSTKVGGTLRTLPAHRVIYGATVEPVPDGMQIDHLCRVRACVNPSHLEVVTASENTRRSAHHNRQKTTCKHGHPYTPENTYSYRQNGGRSSRRMCRTCHQIGRQKTSDAPPSAGL